MTPYGGTSQISDLISKVTLGVETSDATCYFVVLVAKSCLTLFDPMDCSPPGSSVHWISQARILEWVAISISRGSSWLRDQTHDSCVGRRVLYHWALRETHLFIYSIPKPRFIVDLQKSRPKVLVSIWQQHTKKVQNTWDDALSHPSAPAEKISAWSLFSFASLLRILRKLIRKNTRQASYRYK